MIDTKAIRAAAEAANLYWPPDTEIKSGRWPAIDRHIASLNPVTVLALLDRLKAAEKDAARYQWLRDCEDDFTDSFLEKLGSGGKRLEFAIDKAMGELK